MHLLWDSGRQFARRRPADIGGTEGPGPWVGIPNQNKNWNRLS